MSGQPLALAYHSHGEGSGLQGWRRGEDVIDSLPYIDLLSDDVQAKVKQMIAEETTRSAKTPADYLRELPAEPASRFEDHPALQQEMQRCGADACGLRAEVHTFVALSLDEKGLLR